MNTSYFQNPTEFAHELSEQLNGKLSPEEILEVISTDLDEGLFGNLFGNLFKWVGGLFKNPRLKRELDKLGEQLFQTKVKIGNLKVQSDAAIEDYEQSLKDLEDVKSKLTKDPYAVTRGGFGDEDILKSAYEDNIKRQIEQLEELERDIIRRMDAIGEDEEDDRIQKYADKIKMDVMLKSTEAIMRMADAETKRVLSKIQNIYQKNNQMINNDLEQAMKADESLQESYNDYPAAAKANAKKAIEWKEKYGRDVVQGGTEVGWARAHQLAKGESLSADVVSRMAQFNRHRQNSKVAAEFKDEPWRDNGHIAWLIWGGTEGVDWAIEKMKEIKKDSANENKNQYNNMGLRMKKVVSIDEWLKIDKNITSSDSVNEAVTLDAINQLYGFWGTLEDSGVKKLEKNVKNLFFEAINGLVQKHGLSEDEAVKVLNSKMGRKAADQIIDGQADSGLLGLEQYYGKYLKVEIKKVLAMKESVEVNEARSLNKIQKDFTAVTSEMSEVVLKWKEAKESGSAQAQAIFLARLKDLTAKKKGLEREMDEFVMGKDRDVELAGALESFMNERYDATESLAELKAWLLKIGVKFVKSTEEFNGDEGGLWIAPTENDVMGGKRMFDFRKGTNATYSNGILKKIADKAESLGFWFEWYDVETLMVWPIN